MVLLLSSFEIVSRSFLWTSTEKVAGLLPGTRKSERATVLEGQDLFRRTTRPRHSVLGAGVEGGLIVGSLAGCRDTLYAPEPKRNRPAKILRPGGILIR